MYTYVDDFRRLCHCTIKVHSSSEITVAKWEVVYLTERVTESVAAEVPGCVKD